MINRFKKEESGYSLIEVVVAILLLSLAIIPMVSMFDAGLRSAVLGGDYDRARSLANANLEEVKAGGYDEAETMTECAVSPADLDDQDLEGFTCELEVESVGLNNSDEIETDDAGTMLRVTATVEWNDGNDHEASTVIAPGGFG